MDRQKKLVLVLTESGFLDICHGMQAVVAFKAAKRALIEASPEVGMRTIAIQLAHPWEIPDGEPEYIVAHLIYPPHKLHERDATLEDATRYIYGRLLTIQRAFVANNYELGD